MSFALGFHTLDVCACSQQDVVNLYKDLRALLKHFAHIAKSMDTLNEACDILEINNVDILKWGSTKMAGFSDACVQSSHITVPFLDTVFNCKIQEDETKFMASPKGVFFQQLFADLHPVFANRYLHQVVSDEVLTCEVYCIVHETAHVLLDENLSTTDEYMIVWRKISTVTSLLILTQKAPHTLLTSTQRWQEATTLFVWKISSLNVKITCCSAWQTTSQIKPRKKVFPD